MRLSSSIARATLVFVAAVLAVALVYSSSRNALAAHYAGLETRQGHERSVQLEPGNPEAWFLLGRYWEYNLVEPDAQRAIRAYRTSLSLDPHSSSTWLDLASAYESEGDAPAARDAYQQAKRVYPLSAEVAWRYGNFLLRQNEFPVAFAEIRHSVAVDPKRAAEAVSRCWRLDPDINSIIENVLPPSASVYLDAIRELDADAAMDPALTVWDKLRALQPPPQIALAQVIPFTDSLIQAHRIDDAHRVWTQAVALSSFPDPPNDAANSLLWDGGFETGVNGGGFSWSYGAPTLGVQTSLDTKEKHSGQRSLRLIFDGRRNVNFTDVCHIAFVEPGASYHFSAWVHTQALTTEQGVRFRLEWTENAHGAAVETSDVHGTQPWTEVSIPWTASGDDARRVRVCVSRKPGDDFGSRIHGTAWIDDVALVPASPAAFWNVQPAAPPASKSAPASPTPATTSPTQPLPAAATPSSSAQPKAAVAPQPPAKSPGSPQ
ncbi:MAG TPA: tetratricopeptide repeat protein [Candidatus Acidoferrum sp.]